MKLEDFLKSQGYTDADLAGMGTLLNDSKFRTSIEGTITERETLAARNQEWQELHDTKWTPALTAAQEDAAKARRERADLQEQVKIAREYGYLGEDAEAKAREVIEANKQRDAAGAPAGFNPDDPKFRDFAGRFSAAEGDAIALHQYLGEEYRQLHGASINEYVNQQSGKRGMVALRAEAQAARKPIDQYVEEKFNWSGKRAEAQQKIQQEHDAKVAREAVEKYAIEHGANPLTARPQASRDPIIPRTKVGDKQVWEIPTADRRSARLERAYQNEAKARVQ